MLRVVDLVDAMFLKEGLLFLRGHLRHEFGLDGGHRGAKGAKAGVYGQRLRCDVDDSKLAG